MRKSFTSFLITVLCLTVSTLLTAAPPKQLITHNTTNLESNAYIAGSIPSPYPTKAHSDGKVFWAEIRMVCFGHLINNKCPALIQVATNTAEPISIGTLELNVNTGIITPSILHGNGYTLMVNGPGETTLLKD